MGKCGQGPYADSWTKYHRLPELPSLSEHVLLKVCARFEDQVTTTDDLLPSGEASSYRSNPTYLADFALSRRKPEYVVRSKEIRELNRKREKMDSSVEEVLQRLEKWIQKLPGYEGADMKDTEIGSCITGLKMGDGSAREQAVSSQKILGGLGNIAQEFATKRYCSNMMNWGVLPFTTEHPEILEEGDWVFVPDIREAVMNGRTEIDSYIMRDEPVKLALKLPVMGQREREIMTAGCLINYYRNIN